MKRYTSSGWVDEEQGIRNHYGVLIDVSQPSTGVVQNNRVDISDECWEGVDIGYEDHKFDGHETCTSDECWYENVGPWLIGSWKKDEKTGNWSPDQTGEYAAIVRESTTQVVWSERIVLRAAMCSPCYPGQVDLDSGVADEKDGFMAYDLPERFYGEG